MREAIQLFSDKGSRDELGIGQIRDAFSNLLFPGTSTLQTRARYFLLIPWLFQRAADNAAPNQIPARAAVYERQLIEGLRSAGAVEGLIGRQAGASLKILPSSIYWSGMTTFHIVAGGLNREQVRGRRVTRTESEDALDGWGGDWNPTLPPRPRGLPHDVPRGFDLSYDEASWLAERVIQSVPDSHLARLVQRGAPPEPDSSTPFTDPSADDANPENQRTLHHADLFSRAIHGAALLYNLLVAEKYDELPESDRGDLTAGERIAHFSAQFSSWAEDVMARRRDFADWDRGDFWLTVREASPRISPMTTAFVDSWIDAVASGTAYHAAMDGELRTLIVHREHRTKGTLARLVNRKALSRWEGSSGESQLVYRWPQVRTIVTDIHEGLDRAGS